MSALHLHALCTELQIAQGVNHGLVLSIIFLCLGADFGDYSQPLAGPMWLWRVSKELFLPQFCTRLKNRVLQFSERAFAVLFIPVQGMR